MRRLLLINFEQDRDEIYVGFEPQVFEGPEGGEHHLVIGWRVDGRVDVYHPSSLRPDPGKYDIAGKGLARLVCADFNEARFEIDAFGAQASYAFDDAEGRPIRLRVEESSRRRRAPFGLLAPMGDAAEAPSSLPLIFLDEFYFVRRRDTRVVIEVSGRSRRPDALPLPIDGARMLFTRYSARPLIATLNPGGARSLPALEVGAEDRMITWRGHEIELGRGREGRTIEGIVRRGGAHPLRIRFDPPFPDLATFDRRRRARGELVIEAFPSAGRVVGHYEVAGCDEGLRLRVLPSRWEPVPTKLSLRFLYAVAKTFKRWPSTYAWDALVRGADGEAARIEGHWTRIRAS